MAIRAGALVDVADMVSTDWVPVDLALGISSLSGYTLSVARSGLMICLRGRITGLTEDTNNVITDDPLPELFRPGITIQDLPMPTNSASGTLANVRAWVTDTGVLSMRPDSGSTVWVNTFWFGN